MPVTYEIAHAKQRVHTRCVGNVTLQEVLEHFAVLSQDPECPERLDVLLDLTEMTSLPTSEQLGRVPVEMARVRPLVRFGICAIIAPGDALFGMARMYEVFAREYFVASRVFRTMPEGTRWLDSGGR